MRDLIGRAGGGGGGTDPVSGVLTTSPIIGIFRGDEERFEARGKNWVGLTREDNLGELRRDYRETFFFFFFFSRVEETMA